MTHDALPRRLLPHGFQAGSLPLTTHLDLMRMRVRTIAAAIALVPEVFASGLLPSNNLEGLQGED